MREPVLLVGAPPEVVELCERCGLEIAGVFDTATGGAAHDYEVLGDDRSAASVRPALRTVPVIVTPDQPVRRQRLVAHYAALGFRFRSLIAPDAMVSRSAVIGQGVVIQSGAHVSAAVHLGDFVRLNVRANLMHEAVVGDYATVAPNAVVLGRVVVEALCYIGANSTVLPELTVRTGATVGAGAVVTASVAAHATVVGVAARERAGS